MLRKRIALLTFSVRSSHVRAAEVIQGALSDSQQNVEVQTLEVMELARAWFRWFYLRPYLWMLNHAPKLSRILSAGESSRMRYAAVPRWMLRRGCAEALRRLGVFAPNLVVAAGAEACRIAALAKREGRINASVLAVQTDLDARPPAVEREIDVYCVGSDDARAQLIAGGGSPNRVLLCGIPIDPAFSLAFDKSDILQALGLDPRRPVVLVVGGAGRVSLDRIVQSLELCGLSLQVLVVAGIDHRLRAHLESLRRKVALQLHVFGWTDNLPELMAAADVVVTRPGSVATIEALAAGRPMVLTGPSTGLEASCARHLEQRGVALCARNVGDIPQLTYQLLKNPEKLAQMERLARELARPDAAHAIAQVARALLEKATYIDLLASPPARPGESAYLM